jgi:hypothetical protein
MGHHQTEQFELELQDGSCNGQIHVFIFFIKPRYDTQKWLHWWKKYVMIRF